MSILPRDASVDAAIDESISRILIRTSSLGSGFALLGGALSRAASGGKRLRPALVAATYRAISSQSDLSPAVCSTAAAFELLHTAFVVHDDVIDNDIERRGVPNVSGEFRAHAEALGADSAGAATLGDAAAILAGDLLLHEATRLIAFSDTSAENREALFSLLDDAIYVSAAGELADVENSVSTRIDDPDAVLTATFNKTAVYTFSAPLRAGAVLAKASPEALEVLDAAGGRLGLAFQLVDDLIGAFGTAAQAGREAGGDLREAKRTPLVALARESTSWPHVDEALNLAYTGPVAVRAAQVALEASGAREDVSVMLNDALSAARELSQHPALNNETGALIRQLADDIARRTP
ncbi:polyprenyl synthetase family protein [Microbacterium sp. NPDC076911]|uniref:polyprenyl synthetase family protein n=1 Tax=Microbacterium sp. NPDC076911 TaxID=3154958 RepID=UPI003418E978